MINQHTPDLPTALNNLADASEVLIYLDDTLTHTDRVAQRSASGKNLWYSGKHKTFGGNLQVLTDHTGYPL